MNIKKRSWLGYFNALIFIILLFVSGLKYNDKALTGMDFTSLSWPFVFFTIFLLVRIEILNDNLDSLKNKINEIENKDN